MLQGKINKAYPALKRLSEYRLPLKKARLLYTMTKKAEECFEFAVQEHRKSVEEFNGTVNRDGTISFASPEMFGKFQDRTSEIQNFDVEWDIEPVKLVESEVADLKVSPSDINDLDGFVIFE